MHLDLAFSEYWTWQANEPSTSYPPTARRTPGFLTTNPENIVVIQWRWKGSREEFKRFYIVKQNRFLYISRHDRKHLQSFSGSERSPSLFTVVNILSNTVVLNEEISRLILAAPRQPGTVPMLIPALPHGDIASNHFGHFFAEEIPYLIAAYKLGMPLLCNRELLPAHRQLVDLMHLNQIISNTITVADCTHKTYELAHAELRILAVYAKFIKLGTQYTGAILEEGCTPRRRYINDSKSNNNSVAVISRGLLPNKPQRWQDADDFRNFNSPKGYDYKIIYPEQAGPVATSEFLRLKQTRIVVSAAGSAVYQLFADIQRQYEILIVLGPLSPSAPHQYFSTFYPFRNYCWLLYTLSSKTEEWDSAFSCPPKVIEKAVEYILSGNKCSETEFISQDYKLEPPGFTIGHKLKYGLHI